MSEQGSRIADMTEQERIAGLQAQVVELTRERDEAREQLARVLERINDQPRTAICLFCGWSAPVEAAELAALATKHWRICERHPIHILTRELAEARAEIARLETELDRERRLVAELDRQRIQMGESLLRSAEAGAVLAAALEPGRGPWA